MQKIIVIIAILKSGIQNLVKYWMLGFSLVRNILLLLILCAFTCAGNAEIIADNDIAIENIATPILDGILKGITSNNYDVFSENFDAEMRKSNPQKQFKITCQQIYYSYGRYRFKQYMGYYNQKDMTTVLYRGKFDKSKDDVLIKLVITKQKDKYLVAGFWIR